MGYYVGWYVFGCCSGKSIDWREGVGWLWIIVWRWMGWGILVVLFGGVVLWEGYGVDDLFFEIGLGVWMWGFGVLDWWISLSGGWCCNCFCCLCYGLEMMWLLLICWFKSIWWMRRIKCGFLLVMFFV